jgi:CO dehydrogenase/acetyl-CoA synthase alpha subunit
MITQTRNTTILTTRATLCCAAPSRHLLAHLPSVLSHGEEVEEARHPQAKLQILRAVSSLSPLRTCAQD